MRVLVLLSLILMLAILSGCVDSAPQEAPQNECATVECAADPDLLTEDGRDLKTELTAEDSVPAPTWEVGDHFGQHIFDGPDDTAGYHIDSMVIEDTGSAWVIATNSEELARRHAFWDYPFLGTFQKEDLATTGYGVDWDFLFEFPLEDGKTWQRNIRLPHSSYFWTIGYEVNFTATYAPRIDTFEGAYPGFEITGETDRGTLLSYYYVPYIGWYDQFYWYDLETEAPDDYRLKAISMGTGADWNGTYYVADVVQEIEEDNFFCPDPGLDPFCQPTDAVMDYTLQDGENHLFGVVVTGAWGGHARTIVHPPEGDPRMYEKTNDDVPDLQSEGPGDIDRIAHIVPYDEPVIPGDWRVESAGAGVFWGTFIFLMELDVQGGTL